MVIKRILRITEHGVPVFDFKEYARGDEILVSGLITAILKFVEELEQDKLSRLLLEESQFLLQSKESLVFILQVTDEMPEEYAEYISKCILENFMENYGAKMKHFSGNVSVFQGFQKNCKEVLQQCGVDITNALLEEKESQDLRGWCLYSKDGEPMVIRANAPNYNIDSFTIFQVLGKSLRKVTSSIKDSSKGTCIHITHEGDIIHTIVLPFVSIVMESKVDELIVKRYRQFKTKSAQQLFDLFSSVYKPDTIDIFNKNMVSSLTDSGIEENYKDVIDLFKAAEKGLHYLFNNPIHIQILFIENHCIVKVKLLNRTIIMEYHNSIETKEILERTKKMFEQELETKDDIPEVVLEK